LNGKKQLDVVLFFKVTEPEPKSETPIAMRLRFYRKMKPVSRLRRHITEISSMDNFTVKSQYQCLSNFYSVSYVLSERGVSTLLKKGQEWFWFKVNIHGLFRVYSLKPGCKWICTEKSVHIYFESESQRYIYGISLSLSNSV
jgi:hypothetical protein